jgi:hypothetical protein
MDQSFLDVMVKRIETQWLSQYYDNANLGFIEGAIARTVLASVLRSEDVVKLGLKWIAFVPSVLSESVWYMAFDPKKINLKEWEPEPFAPPPALVEAIRPLEGSGNPIRVKLSSLSREATAWETLADVDQLYIFESSDMKWLDDVNGQIVLALPNMFFAQARITRAVQAVNKQIRERARLLAAAKPATLRLINQLDNRYQEKIMRAIEGRELNRLLQQSSEPPRVQTKGAERRDMRELISYSPQQKRLSAEEKFKANQNGYQGSFFRVAAQFGELKSEDQNFNATKQTFLQFGEFYGRAKYKNGGQAFFTVIDRLESYYDILVRFVKDGVYKRESVMLFILPDERIRNEILSISKPWKKLFEAYGHRLGVEILGD